MEHLQRSPAELPEKITLLDLGPRVAHTNTTESKMKAMNNTATCIRGFFICLLLAGVATAAEPTIALTSPDGKLQATLHVDPAGRLGYGVSRGASPVLAKSELGITIDGVDLGLKASVVGKKRSTVNETYPWRGVHSMAKNHYNGLSLSMQTGKTKWVMETRCYNDGFAFRYVIPGQAKRTISGEATSFVLPAGYTVKALGYRGPGEEGLVTEFSSETLSAKKPISMPLVYFSSKAKRFNAILEGGGFTYHGVSLSADGKNTLRSHFLDMPSWSVTGTIESSWRIICSCDDLNGLVNSDLVHNVCPPPDKTLFPQGMHTKWIQPGKSVWDWWAKMGSKFKVSKTLIPYAKAIGADYVLVDYGWEAAWFGRLKEYCDLAKTHGIGVIVWKPSPIGMGNLKKVIAEMKNPPRLPNGEIDISKIKTKHDNYQNIVVSEDRTKRRAMFKHLAEAGVKAIKLDYIDSENARWKTYMVNVLTDAAEFKLMVDFHGCCVPAGESRTFPNEITREAIYGLEKLRGGGGAKKFPTRRYVNLAFTRLLAGHADFTPTTLGAKADGYTQTMQVASALVFTSPMLIWGEHGKLLQASPALPVIQSMPTQWDETIVLPSSKFDDLAVFARRKGKDWYVAMINGHAKTPQSYTLKLDFLPKGKYTMFLCKDIEGSPNIATETRTVSAGDTLQVKMNPSGGFIARFQPAAKKLLGE